jgi:ATP-dependent DNA helicase RecG
MTTMSREKSPAELLSTPVQFVKGVGPHRAELLERLELRTVQDVLFSFPRDYQDLSELCPIERLRDGELASVCGVVEEIELRNTGVGRSMLGVLLRQGSQYLRAVWFNQPYVADKFARGQRVLLAGKPRLRGFRWEMSHPAVTHLGADEQPPAARVLPVYSLTEGLNQWQMRRIVQGIVDQHADLLEETFPESFLAEHQLLGIRRALREIHFPPDRTSLERARRRFVYQELLVMQLALAWRRWRLVHQRRAAALPADARIDARILRLFPFELTEGQRGAMAEIAADMGNPFPMNRLLQGEVGSGKTVVAEYAMLLCVAHQHQAVLMTPTEILARQHARTLAKALEQSRVRIALLTGALTPALRRETLAAIAEGRIDLVVGTQAVLGDDVKFARLGLVIIDEQHKFGVRQRAGLRQTGTDPHYLVMTATPIPRTVSMTLFGDLDVSTLRELPPGRQPVHTYLAGEAKRAAWWDFFRRRLHEGRQGYVIAPLVDGSDESSVASAERMFESLANGELEAFRLGILHGRQTPDEKDEALSKFRRGEFQVLVTTLVVEVGVDIANATLMTVEGAERFGLAQLHQLRGRVSRGVHPGYVCLFPGSDNAAAVERLESFCRTLDGFELAELDFQLRGPGDLLGSRQHGLPPFRIANLVRDAELVQQARRDAQALIAADPELVDPAWVRLRRMVLARYGEVMELGDVG